MPWLLLQNGRAGDADRAAALSDLPVVEPGLAEIAETLADIAARTPFDLAGQMRDLQPPKAIAEAEAIHETYCAGCHDGAGAGDPDEALPARDLRQMAQEGPPSEFLARLVSGIKGDETIAFRTPMTDRQLLALRVFYFGDGEE